jgi:hypothetical protein
LVPIALQSYVLSKLSNGTASSVSFSEELNPSASLESVRPLLSRLEERRATGKKESQLALFQILDKLRFLRQERLGKWFTHRTLDVHEDSPDGRFFFGSYPGEAKVQAVPLDDIGFKNDFDARFESNAFLAACEISFSQDGSRA